MAIEAVDTQITVCVFISSSARRRSRLVVIPVAMLSIRSAWNMTAQLLGHAAVACCLLLPCRHFARLSRHK